MRSVAFPDTNPSLLSALRRRPDDGEAWDRFVRTYAPHLLQWCRRWGLQEADAHDVTQSVLMRFLRRAGNFEYDPSRRFRGWLRALTHSTWCTYAERQGRWQQGRGGDDASRRIELIAARDDLSNLIEKEYAEELLRKAMEQVSSRVEPQTWQAFWLLNKEGLSGREAAERLGMRVGSAYAASSKVRRMIREEVSRRDLSSS